MPDSISFNLGDFYTKHRNKVFWFVLFVAVVYALFFFRFRTMMPQFAGIEVQSAQTSHSLRTILHDPTNAPYKVLVWLPLKFGVHSWLVTRIAASIFAAVTVWLFFLVLRQRYSLRQAVLGTILFATSSGFLHAARLGAPYILQSVMLLPFLLPLMWHNKRIPNNLIAYITIFLVAVSLYVPGFIWLALAGLGLFYKQLRVILRSMDKKHLIISNVLALSLLVPLVWAIARDVHVLKSVLGFGDSLPTLTAFAHGLLDTVKSLIYSSNAGAELTLVGAPVLSAIDIFLAILGVIFLWQKPRSATTYYLTGILALSIVLTALGGPVKLFMALPLIYMCVAAGVFFLLNEWMKVFPRNPVARSLAVGLLCLLVIFSSIFHLRSYFIAWPHNEHTKATFVERQP